MRLKLIHGLKANSSCGCDNISPKVLKYSHPYLVDPLVHLVNMSFTQGYFPDELKIAKVVPIFKSGDPQLPSNYRPISILSILSKIFERIFYIRLYDFLNQENILYENQFGFRKAHSTEMALILVLDKISDALDNGDYVLGVYLDFSKAFDTVNHSILLQKLYHYGIRGVAYNWIKSYLDKRTQYVSYNDASSTKKTINCGVPQGSILGPLLFLIYINDLANVTSNLFMFMFADDTNVFLSGKNLNDLETIMNNELKLLYEWLCSNRLSLNVSKTHFMVFSPTRKKPVQIPSLKIENSEITRVMHTKFLGVILDDKLSWNQHVSYIKGKISKSLGIMYRTKRFLNKESIKSLYFAFLYPYLVYCLTVWGGANMTTVLPIIKIQKKAVRCIAGVSKKVSSASLFKELKILPFKNVYKLQVLLFVYKYRLSLLPKIFNNFFIKTTDVHHHFTRQQYDYHIPRCKSELTKSFIRYTGCIYWNNLDNKDKSVYMTVTGFKKHITKKLM
jgi:hypothetical protein